MPSDAAPDPDVPDPDRNHPDDTDSDNARLVRPVADDTRSIRTDADAPDPDVTTARAPNRAHQRCAPTQVPDYRSGSGSAIRTPWNPPTTPCPPTTLENSGLGSANGLPSLISC